MDRGRNEEKVFFCKFTFSCEDNLKTMLIEPLHFRFTTEGYIYSEVSVKCPEHVNNNWKFSNGKKGWQHANREFNFYCQPSNGAYQIDTRYY